MIAKVACHHLDHTLLVRSKSLVLPTREGGDHTRRKYQGKGAMAGAGRGCLSVVTNGVKSHRLRFSCIPPSAAFAILMSGSVQLSTPLTYLIPHRLHSQLICLNHLVGIISHSSPARYVGNRQTRRHKYANTYGHRHAWICLSYLFH